LWQWKCAWFCIAIGWISRPTCPKKGQGSARKKTLYRFIGNPNFGSYVSGSFFQFYG
jgi:hypothetical protein